MSDLVKRQENDIEKYFQDSNVLVKIPKVVCTCHNGTMYQLGFQKIFYVYDESYGRLRRVTRTIFGCSFCHKIWPFIETKFIEYDDSIDKDKIITIPRYPLLTKDFFGNGGYYGLEYLISPFEDRKNYPVILVRKEGDGWSEPFLVELPANLDKVGEEDIVPDNYLNVHKNVKLSLNFKASDGTGIYKDNEATTFSEIDYRGFMVSYRQNRFNAKVYLPLAYSSDYIIKKDKNVLYYPERKMLEINNIKCLDEKKDER